MGYDNGLDVSDWRSVLKAGFCESDVEPSVSVTRN
jgi:hypothetical protein